jgi:rhodanese-related sulfurtransferase
MSAAIREIDPADARQLVEAGRAVLVDVREAMEHARERIAGAAHLPLSRIDGGAALSSGAETVIFHCRTGTRTAMNAGKLAACGAGEFYVLKGGLDGWKASGLPTLIDRKAPIDVMRQVQIAAGSLVLAGLVLALAVSPWFAALSAFVGAGLVFAGVSGFCGMARILARMPWNRVKA